MGYMKPISPYRLFLGILVGFFFGYITNYFFMFGMLGTLIAVLPEVLYFGGKKKTRKKQSAPMIVLTTPGWRKEYFNTFWSHHLPFSTFCVTLGKAKSEKDITENLEQLFKFVTNVISNNNGAIPSVFSMLDICKVAHTWLIEQLQKRLNIRMLGGITKAHFCGTHKILSRIAIDGMSGIQFAPVYAHEKTLSNLFRSKKVIAKPITGSGSIGIKVVNNNVEKPTKNPFYKSVVEECPLDVIMKRQVKPELKKFGIEYDGLVAIAEEYIDPLVKKISINGYVHRGKVRVLTSCSNIYNEDDPDAFDYICVPSLLPKSVLKEGYKKFIKVVTSLHEKFGMDNQMVNIEMFALEKPEEGVKVMEINTRATANDLCTFNYCHEGLTCDGMEIQKMFQSETYEKIPDAIPNGKYGITLYRPVIKNAPKVLCEGKFKIYNTGMVNKFHIFMCAENKESIKETVRDGNMWYESLKKRYNSRKKNYLEIV